LNGSSPAWPAIGWIRVQLVAGVEAARAALVRGVAGVDERDRTDLQRAIGVQVAGRRCYRLALASSVALTMPLRESLMQRA
jgi:hypothetical protein